MSRQEKLLKRLLSRPKDFLWSEAATLLKSYGYEVFNGSGSRRKFIHPETKQVISFDEPHPKKQLKSYILDLIIAGLKEGGFISEQDA